MALRSTRTPTGWTWLRSPELRQPLEKKARPFGRAFPFQAATMRRRSQITRMISSVCHVAGAWGRLHEDGSSPRPRNPSLHPDPSPPKSSRLLKNGCGCRVWPFATRDARKTSRREDFSLEKRREQKASHRKRSRRRGAVCGVAAPLRCAPASPSSRLLASGLAALATPASHHPRVAKELPWDPIAADIGTAPAGCSFPPPTDIFMSHGLL